MNGSTSSTSKLPWRHRARQLWSSKPSSTKVPPAPSVPTSTASTTQSSTPVPQQTVTSTPTPRAASVTRPSSSHSGSNCAATPSSSSPTSATTQLLQTALRRLNKEERTTIERHVPQSSVDSQLVINDAVKAAKSKRQACLDKRWSFTISGRDVVLREQADKVVYWLNRFKSIGDVVANADPIHMGLPWAGIRVLLEVAVAESNQMAALLAGCETTLYMASRLQVYVEFWHCLPASAVENNLGESITMMYAHILHFLARAIHSCEASTVWRNISALWTVDDAVDFRKRGDDLAMKIEFDASNCDRTIDAQGQATVQQLLKHMQQVLADLQHQHHHHHQLQASLDDLGTKLDLDKIHYASGAIFNASDGVHTLCHPATRHEILSQVQAWARQPDGKSIFWLYGGAGAGKSTISWTIAQWLTDSGGQGDINLGASFFFKRGEGDRGSARRFFPTVVRQLVAKIPGLDVLVAKAIKSDTFILEKALAEQFRILILQPLQGLSVTGADRLTLVVVVDALDECDSETDTRTLLELWSHLSQITTVRLRLLVTSRPELPIRLEFQRMSTDGHRDVDLVEAVSPNTIQHDLFIYLRDSLSSIRETYNDRFPGKTILDNNWPSKELIQQLADLSKPLFIVAATICRFTGDLDFNPRDNLDEYLNHRSTYQLSQMEATYLPVLSHLVKRTRDNRQAARLYSEFRTIVGSIILLAEPLTVSSLADLLHVSTEAVSRRLAVLHSVLRVPADDHTPVRTLHLSFAEFLLSDEAQKQPFGIDRRGTHLALSQRCLHILSSANGLRENICDLDHPGQSRREVVSTTIASRLSPVLQYACRYWVHHVQRSHHQNESGGVIPSLQDGGLVHSFLEQHFLHWLEALSLMDRLSEAIGLVGVLQSCLLATASHLSALLEDARRFVLTNRHIVDTAPLQLYSSAIIFAPQNSVVRARCGRVPEWIKQHPRTRTEWGIELQKLEGCSRPVWTVAFSPDGHLLASGSHDHMVRLWDTQTGGEIQKLEGHSSSVRAVAFSPSNSRVLASGSHDHTVRLWDTQTGSELYRLEGHSNPVWAVTFSPNSYTLASGSEDGTIRIWNIHTGYEVQKLEGHSSSVEAVAFSPKDSCILASGSYDHTIRLWNIQTGGEIQTLKGSSTPVEAVAFSPDGRMLASGSHDHMVRLWDTQTGGEIRTLEGHSGWVRVVAFSPNGRMLASGSLDRTVRLWDTQISGDEVQRLEGHSSSVEAVAFSPNDGRILVSGSYDHTIRLWDVQTNSGEVQRLERQRLEGHSNPVWVVAFSPNGSILASGSEDGTIRLWNTQTGGEIHRLDGHFSWVEVVAFSCNGRVLASGSHDRTIRLWDTQTGSELYRLEGHSSPVVAVAFSPDDGYTLASGSYDHTVRLWDTQTGSEIRTLKGHSGWINVVAFSPDNGHSLASASEDGTIRIWDTQTGNEVQKLEAIPTAHSIRFTSNTTLVTDRGTFRLGDGSIVNTESLKSDDDGAISVTGEWIRRGDHNLLWLPHEYRGRATLHDGKVALGADSGLVSIFQFESS